MLGHDGVPLPEQLLREDLWVADVVYFPLRTRLLAVRPGRGAAVLGGGGMAVFQAVGAFECFTGVEPDAARMTAHFAELTGLMRTGIATVSLSGLLADKLDAIAGAGFDGVEIFDNDLVACPLPPREVARRCADLGLAIDLFQPVRDVEGVPPERFAAVLHRVAHKLDVMAELGATRVLACSNVAADAWPTST